MSFKEKAEALLVLKDSLGDFYEEQKNFLLDDVLDLPLQDCAPVLSSLVSCKFISPQELSSLLTRKTQGSKSSTVSPAPEGTYEEKNEEKQSDNKEISCQFNSDSSLDQVEEYVRSTHPGKAEDYCNLLQELRASVGIGNVAELLNLEQSHASFNILDELLPEHSRLAFITLMKDLQAIEFFSQSQLQVEEKLSKIEEQRKAEELADSMLYHFQSPEARVLVVPAAKRFHFFASVELPQGEEALSVESKAQCVYFCLDISASMNHNQHGEYCAPKSRDHAYSSIKKARELIPQLALAAIQRYANVYVIVWNYKVQNVIEFTPEMFLQEDANEFVETEKIYASIVEQTSEAVFVAKGGTNMEAALNQMEELWERHQTTMSSAIAWFLTDGEETVYVKQEATNGKEPVMDRIPSNPNSEMFGYFNHTNAEGITQYQAKLLNRLATRMELLANKNISVEFHVCQFKDADPMFLRCMREATNGYFHTLVDVANLAKEIEANNSSSQFSLQFLSSTASPFVTPASISNGVMYARGELPSDIFVRDCLSKRSVELLPQGQKNKCSLTVFSTDPFKDPLLSGVKNIIELEPALDSIMALLNENVTSESIYKASNKLRNLRNIRMEALASIARIVRAGTPLQMFLESILESVASQMDSLERLLAQFQLAEGKAFDEASAKSNDLLTFREKMAISAGLESMRVRLGNGIVSQSMDKRISHLVAKTGSRARQMLNRRCILVESLRGDFTWLSLFIVEGDIYEEARARFLMNVREKLFPNEPENSSLRMELKESFSHDEKNATDCYVDAQVTIWTQDSKNNQIYAEKIELKAFFMCFVAEYHCQPKEEDLDEARKRFVDPLSYCSFIDLIQENNTLPAFLYRLGSSQSVGLLFNAKELVFVEGGGQDATSFDYFRLYWRLAKKEDGSYVTVPGTFSKANAALPMAPEPLTNFVLANLMPGLLSEFITGTPMAAISGIALLYSGYLMMHMHRKPMSGVDISRVVEIISTMATWMDNPRTIPHRSEVNEIVQQVVEKKSVAPKDSPGKKIPVKAVVYCILDDQYPAADKLTGLQTIIFTRMYKRLASSSARQPMNIKELCLSFVMAATGDIQYQDDVPISLLDKAKEISAVVTDATVSPHGFVENGRHCAALIELLHVVITEYESVGVWSETQRFLHVFYVLATLSTKALQERFRLFQDTNAVETSISNALKYRDSSIPWERALFTFYDSQQNYLLLCFDEENKQVQVWNVTQAACVDTRTNNELHLLPLEARVALWEACKPLLDRWYWNGRASNAYSLLDVDYEIVAAMKDSSHLNQLSQIQISEYHAAMAHKKPAYAQWAPEKEKLVEISASDNVSIALDMKMSGKPRMSMIVIGNVDSGKSTTSGHLIYKRGCIPQHVMNKVEQLASETGKISFKYAWIMDRLRTERERGVTVETSMWSLETEKYQLDLLDAPGHHSFLKNMASGASLSDSALLVVSARHGEFESGIVRDGMTRQEALLAYTSGVRQFIVAVNKMDQVNYAQDRFEEIKKEVSSYLRTLGVAEHRQIFIPISGWTGDNLVEPSDKMAWFTGWTCKETNESSDIKEGKTLLDAVDYGLIIPKRAPDRPLRIPVLRTFKIPGVGTVATGRIATGTVQPGQELVIMPLNKKATVRTIESYHQGKSVGYPGDIIAVHLPGIKREEIPRGFVLSPKDCPTPSVMAFTAKILISNHRNVKAGFSPYIYCHTASFACTFSQLLEKCDKKTGKVIEKYPEIVRTGDLALVVISVAKPVCVEPFSICPPLGRFAVQMCSSVVGVGVVKDVFPYDPHAPKINTMTKSKYFH